MTDLIPTFACAIALVRHNGRFLMIQEAKEQCRGLWSFPGGRIDPGEAVADGIVREVKEEAGVVIKPTGLLRIEHARMNVDNLWRERLRYVFEGDYISGELKDWEDLESLCAAWQSPEEIANLKLREELSTDYIRNIEHYVRLPLDQFVYWNRSFDR